MTKHNTPRCHICYEATADHAFYHPACLRKLFNTETMPRIDFTMQHLTQLAIDFMREKRGLPGVQRKLSLSLVTDKQEHVASKRLTIIGVLGGEYILKPPSEHYPQMPENEDLTMHLAELAQIEVPAHGLIKMHDGSLAYIVKRFDRKGKKKIAAEDLCQLSLKMSEDKYKSSSEQVGKVIRKHSSNPGDDALRYFELVLFSFLVGNADMHLKNFSLIIHGRDAIKLSPSYDLLSTKLLFPEHIDPEALALSLNGKKSNFKRKDFLTFAETLQIPNKVVERSMNQMVGYRDVWNRKIEQSFLNEGFKVRYLDLIEKNSRTLMS